MKNTYMSMFFLIINAHKFSQHIKVMRDYDLILDVLNPEAWTPAAVLAVSIYHL